MNYFLARLQQRPVLNLLTWPIMNWVVVISALTAVVFAMMSTSHGGIGATPDTINYVAASKSLLAGDGYLRFFHTPFASWPPLYPTLLAGVNVVSRWLGWDIAEGIRFAQAIVFGLIVYASGRLLLRCIQSRLFALLALISIVFSFPLLRDAIFGWSEAVYILLSLLVALYLPTFLREQKLHQLALLALMTMLASLERYAGIGIIPASIVCIILAQSSITPAKRLMYGITLGLSAVPYALWILYATSYLPRPAVHAENNSLASLLLNVRLTADLLATWFLPSALRSIVPSGIVFLVVLLTIGGVIVFYYRHKAALPVEAIISAFYVIVYMVFFYLAHTLIDSTPVDERHLSVLYPYVILLIFLLLEHLTWPFKSHQWWRVAIVGAAALWLVYPIVTDAGEITGFSTWCCMADQYRQLSLIKWLNSHLVDGVVYSNTPLPLFYTPLTVYSVPAERAAWSQEKFSPNHDTYIVWFSNAEQYSGTASPYYYDLNYDVTSLSSLAHVELVAEFPEGRIYRLRRM
jgi:hypothetical protein